MFDKGMNNWKYDLEQMLVLSYISTSFGILFLLPRVEGENVRARRDPPNLPIVRMRKCSQRGECLSPGHLPFSGFVMSHPMLCPPHCISLTPFQCPVLAPIPIPSSSLASFLPTSPLPALHSECPQLMFNVVHSALGM